jgi:D-alanine-D-alanine ligase
VTPRHILILHPDITPDAPPEDLDTLVQVEAIEAVLKARRQIVSRAAFTRDPDGLAAIIKSHSADVVFNLVESVDGSGRESAIVPAMLDALGVKYTGAGGIELAATCDKPLTKRILRDAGLPTPDWSEPPGWEGLNDVTRYIVKSALEDASVGLDDDSVVTGAAKVRARAAACEKQFGGRWFAEAYVHGREFNVAVLQRGSGPQILPLAEMTFQEWQPGRVKIVGYRAKWDDDSFDSTRTVRAFGLEESEPALAAELSDLARRTWNLLGINGYARIDFRIDEQGRPTILEVNPNPCLSPDAGFAAAAERTGLSYERLMAHIVDTALTEPR